MFKRRILVPVLYWRYFSSIPAPSTATSTISIPTRIKRKPTDLLKALASTVKDDPTGYSSMYIDDPLFTPMKPFEAQNFALSKELGRKAAKYFAAQYPTLFMYDEDEPRLMAFRPIQKPTSENADDEASLNDRIDRLWVRSAMAVYENAMARQKSISTSTKLKLLELLAFYNNDDPNEIMDSSIELWFRSYLNPPTKTAWMDDGLAMKIYESLPEPKEPRATAAIICGMLKYFAVEKAYDLWLLSRMGGEDGKLKDARIYESIIKYGVERLKAVNSERWDLILELFRAMTEDGIKPTLHIFNGAFEILSKASRWRKTEEAAKQLFQEMIQSGIQPSMATYYHILRIHGKRQNLAGVMDAILTSLERNSSEQQHYALLDEKDGKFFIEAMTYCCEHLHDRTLALRLHRLLKTGDNYLYMTQSADETNYYRILITFLSMTEDTKTFYERVYHRTVPRYFIPDTRLLSGCLQNIEMFGDYGYLSQVCSDMISYGHVYRREMVWTFLSTVLRAPTSQMKKDVSEKFVQMAKDIYERIELQYLAIEQRRALERKRLGDINDLKNTNKSANEGEKMEGNRGKKEQGKRDFRNQDDIRLEWTSDLLAQLSVMCARGGDVKGAWNMYSRLIPLTEEELLKLKHEKEEDPTKTTTTIFGEVPEKLAVEMLEHFVKRKWFDQSYAALKVIARNNNPELIKESAEKIKKTIPTNAIQLGKLEKYLNIEILEKTKKKMIQEEDL